LLVLTLSTGSVVMGSSGLVCVQADMLGANDCATIVMAILEGISSAHENLAKLLELMPKLLLTVCPHLLETLLVHHLLLLPSAVP